MLLCWRWKYVTVMNLWPLEGVSRKCLHTNLLFTTPIATLLTYCIFSATAGPDLLPTQHMVRVEVTTSRWCRWSRKAKWCTKQTQDDHKLSLRLQYSIYELWNLKRSCKSFYGSTFVPELHFIYVGLVWVFWLLVCEHVQQFVIYIVTIKMN